LTDTDSWIGVNKYPACASKALSPTSDNQIKSLISLFATSPKSTPSSKALEHTHDFINEEEKRSTKEGGGDEVDGL
jgi:hypothetical protein